MNERIKELIKQAGPNTMEELNADRTNVHVIDVKKFAELVVRECGVALSPMLRDMVSRGQAFDLIKQHFGIEE